MDLIRSKYEGQRNNERIEGEGTYVSPLGTKYVGGFKDGMFHGKGTLYFTDGCKNDGEWERGCRIKGTHIFADNLVYDETAFKYCNGIDRRFYKEHLNRLLPAGISMLTNDYEPKIIPDGHYDTGDGFYNPEDRVVYSYKMEFLRNADYIEHKWILKYCRHAGDRYIKNTDYD